MESVFNWREDFGLSLTSADPVHTLVLNIGTPAASVWIFCELNLH